MPGYQPAFGSAWSGLRGRCKIAPMPRRRRSVKRNSGSKSLSWGTLPEYPAFAEHVQRAVDEDDQPVIGPPGDVYHMELVGKDAAAAKLALKTLFSTGTKVSFDQFQGKHGKYGLRFNDLLSLHKFILALLTVDEMEAEADPDADRQETPGDLASSIMGTLGYEWV